MISPQFTWRFLFLFTSLLLLPLPTQASVAQREQQLASIDSELAGLAQLTLRSDVGNQGWQSQAHNSPQHTEWVEIALPKGQVFQQVVLVPVLWNHSEKGVQADGFPLELQIIAGKNSSKKGKVIASFSKSDAHLPRISPLVIDVEPTRADWIRIKGTSLSARAIDQRYSMRLAEVFVFSGAKNIALHQAVQFSSVQGTIVKTIPASKAIVDGFTPYVMNAAQGKKSSAFVAFFSNRVQPSIVIDLGIAAQLEQINLHAVDIQETVPHLQHGDYALPKHMLVEAANKADFSDATLLAEFQRQSIYAAAPIIPIKLEVSKKPFRYLRLHMVDSYRAPEATDAYRCIGFAEIEVISNSKNIAQGKIFNMSGDFTRIQGQIKALSDGHNHFGQVLPTRPWLAQLARRHQLESERPQVLAQLNLEYAQQQKQLNLLQWSLALILLITIVLFLLERYRWRQAIAKTRERIAADLHDELGANVSAIGILSDLAQEEVPNNAHLADILERIRSLTNRTSSAVRYCSNMLASYPIQGNLLEEMQRSSKRLLADTEHQFSAEGVENLAYLKPRQRLDMFLFYQECLANIVQHAQASKVYTRIQAYSNEIVLSVEDNGIGTKGQTPKSLKRRAKLLRASVHSKPLKNSGTQICLKLKLKRSLWR